MDEDLQNFTSMFWATERVKRRLGLETSDQDTEIQEMLNLSAATMGTHPGTKFYRPYLVAALLLSQDIDANRLKKASGVEFNDMSPVIGSLLALQLGYDNLFGWIVPLGFQTAAMGIEKPAKLRSLRYGSSVNFTPTFRGF
jgi:hypothetical protein